MEWNQAALDKAARENKLLFVSIGYFSCHWCHVMQRESFADQEVAAALNKHYVSIKVDRELNPVLDKRLIEFVQATIGRAGWPLNVILTPQRYPLTGATYLPKDHFYGALNRLSGMWAESEEQLEDDALSLNRQLAERRKAADLKGNLPALGDNLASFVDVVMNQADLMQGGFGQQNKFPMFTQLRALMEMNRKLRREDIDEFLILTLDQMQSRGLNDAIGGGFFRYTVDPGWETPHFEKMLYTNALLTELYIDAWRQFGREDYRQTALRTLEFMQREMLAPEGGFISSLSAVDDNNVEGGYYLFDQQTLKSFLDNSELSMANHEFSLDRPADLPDGVLPHAGELNAVSDKRKQLRHKILDWRITNRVVPPDDKQLAGWNGLALSAMASAYAIDSGFQKDGQKLADFLTGLVNEEGVLRRSFRSPLEASLGDYAFVSLGLLRWARASGDKDSQTTGEQLVKKAWEIFYSDNGWLESDDSLLPGDYRRLHIPDGALPSPETQLLRATILLDNKPPFRELRLKAQELTSRSTTGIERNPFVYASLIAMSVN